LKRSESGTRRKFYGSFYDEDMDDEVEEFSDLPHKHIDIQVM
jgi:hypothetical protein